MMSLDDGILHQIFHEVKSQYEADYNNETVYMQNGVKIH